MEVSNKRFDGCGVIKLLTFRLGELVDEEVQGLFRPMDDELFQQILK
jgi:hypothetical protein